MGKQPLKDHKTVQAKVKKIPSEERAIQYV